MKCRIGRSASNREILLFEMSFHSPARNDTVSGLIHATASHMHAGKLSEGEFGWGGTLVKR